MNADPDARRQLFEFVVREGMLSVHVRTDAGWAPRGFAWEAMDVRKDQALEVPVADVSGDRLALRLDSDVGFWSIDSLAVSYDDDEPVEVHTLAPRTAVTSDGRDIAGLLSSVDGERYATRPGDQAVLVFDALAAPPPEKERSLVLVTTGFYVPDVAPDPRANLAETQRLMTTPGAAARRSLELLENEVAREMSR
jgi:hypothetical protein